MSAAPGRPQGSHGIDRKQADYDAFADQCVAKGQPIDVFYPERGYRNTDPAKAICRGCPVKQACLDYALKYDEWYGVWGGRSVKERRIIKRAQKQLAKAGAQ